MKKTGRRLFTLLIGTALCLSLALPAAAVMDVVKFNGDIFSKEQTVALGTNAEFMLKSDDSLWAWGDNTYGEIGDGNGFAPYFKDGHGWVNSYVTTPCKILDNVRDLSAEGTWAITKDNALWVWGKTACILGLADSAQTSTPKKYMDNVRWFSYGESRDDPVIGWPYDAESMDLKYNMFLVKTDGTLLGWGHNAYGELGDGTTRERTEPTPIMTGVRYVEYVEGQGANLAPVPGHGHVFVIKEDNSLWGWGASAYALIDPNRGQIDTTPRKYLDDVRTIAGTGGAVLALTNAGGLYVWGGLPSKVEGASSYSFGSSSSAGASTDTRYYTDTFYHVADHVREAHVYNSTGRWFTYITTGNEVYNWGFNGNGYHETPTKIMDDVATMSDAFGRYMVKTNGELWQYVGDTYHSETGQTTYDAPQKLMDHVAGVVCSQGDLTYVVKTDGSLWGKGYDADMQMMGKGYQTSFVKLVDSGVKLPYTVQQPVPPEKTVGGFSDVRESAYYADAVAWAVEHKITQGTSATTFSPDVTCSRAQIVTFLWRAYGSPEPKSTVNPFVDVKPSDHFYQAVLWAAENKITSGTGTTTFSPNAPCDRAEAVTFQYRAAGAPAVSGGSAFRDVPAEAFYADAVQWAVENAMTSGTGAATFSPDAACSRAQIVTLLYRGMGR